MQDNNTGYTGIYNYTGRQESNSQIGRQESKSRTGRQDSYRVCRTANRKTDGHVGRTANRRTGRQDRNRQADMQAVSQACRHASSKVS